MKKFLIVLAVALMGSTCVKAQDNNFLNHLSIGVNAGILQGIGVDAAVPLGNHFQVRAGVAFIPKVELSTDLNVDGYYPDEVRDNIGVVGAVPSEIEVAGKLNIFNGKILADIYPFKSSSFHLTAGAYFGTSDIISVYNKEDGALMAITEANRKIDQFNVTPELTALYGTQDKIGVELGDYLLTSDPNGNIKASIKTASFKPYLGIGFGRAVPKKRVGLMMEAGAMFWGSPKVYCTDEAGVERQLTSADVDGEGGDIMKILSKVTICPVINFRLCFRAF